jgi:biopolymer transport protein ExbD
MSFSSPSRERSRPVLPLSAMVDVLFLLLIFFMYTSTMREQALQMDVSLAPTRSVETAGTSARQTAITITAGDQIQLGGQTMELPELERVLASLLEQSPGESVVIYADQNSRSGMLVQVMDIAALAGVADVSVATVRAVE